MKSTMMKVCLVLALSFFISGCAINGPMPPAAWVITSVKAPDSASTIALRTGTFDKVKPIKKGEATATSLLNIIATGDASIQAAMNDAGITQVHHVDYQKTILLFGLYHSLTTIVYGE